jgi:preprotein translocase subunit SecD
MNPNLKWKALFIAVIILLSIFGLLGLPTFPTSWAQAKENFANRIQLGLDLKGGTHLILQVQVNEAVTQHVQQMADNLLRDKDSKGLNIEEIRVLDGQPPRILVRNIDAAHTSAFQDLVRDLYRDFELAPAPGEQSGYVLTLRPSSIAAIRSTTMQQAVDTIDRRVNQLGLTEPTIALHGRSEDEILVQLPGEGDPARAKAIIQAGGQLEFRLVRDERQYSSEAEGYAENGGKLPPETELVRGRFETAEPGKAASAVEVWYLLDKRPVVVGRDLRNATAVPSTDRPGRYEVNFTLSTEAGKRMGNFTQANVGKHMAIVLDRRVQSAPEIQERFEDQARITGSFGQQEARDLALVLRAGSLPASIKYLEERTVGPSLGADSIRQGFQASVASLIVVMLFMLFYYRMAGVNAVLALVLNLVLLMASLAYFGAVLTLPGVAGVILTIGIGVDTNVLVFERIREELRAGKAAASAVDTGFNRAWITVLDTHVTTIVSCIFLGVFGTGPVRGFAVTLVIGLLSNLFTAIYVSKTIFHWHLGRMSREQQLSI